MEVLIVSKTRMGNNMACVGGMVLGSGRDVRLMNPGNWNQPGDTPFEVGAVWDIGFSDRRALSPPHVEDVIVHGRSFVRNIADMDAFLREQRAVNWSGPFERLFDGHVHCTKSGTGYIPQDGPLPRMSVGFWVADKDLVRSDHEGKTKYRYQPYPGVKSLSYVGFQPAVECIPAGTILRVSLSRLFIPPTDSQAPQGYYLQLSGWYDHPNANSWPAF